MKIDTRPRKRNSPRPAEKSALGFLQWLRGRECLACAVAEIHPEYRIKKIEAAHVDHAGGKGVGTKVADRFAIPLCGGLNGHHAEQHRMGWRSFEAKYHFDAVSAAKTYWNAWPGRIAWERKLEAGK